MQDSDSTTQEETAPQESGPDLVEELTRQVGEQDWIPEPLLPYWEFLLDYPWIAGVLIAVGGFLTAKLVVFVFRFVVFFFFFFVVFFFAVFFFLRVVDVFFFDELAFFLLERFGLAAASAGASRINVFTASTSSLPIQRRYSRRTSVSQKRSRQSAALSRLSRAQLKKSHWNAGSRSSSEPQRSFLISGVVNP